MIRRRTGARSSRRRRPRAHHQNGCANISEVASGFPGYNSHIPFENAFLAEVLRQRGWNTFWVGKNHNIPIDEWAMGGSKRNWPLARGFDRFYGFLGGETNQWYPDLAQDNQFIEQPYLPEDGYHVSKDLADKAISFIRDSKQSDPAKPWFTFFCPGANHAPHHAPQEWIDKYKGVFDDGYEAYREWVLPRMVERGILPAIVMYAADNRASGEGSPTGSVNENKFFNGFPDDVEENLTMLDKLGSPDTYNHYPTGWAAAFSTPFRMFKRYSYLGGVSDPLVIHWPAGIKAAGEVRDQYHHVIDIVPTILDCRGVELPDTVNGYAQTPLPGDSMRYTFEDAAAKTVKTVQYYEMMGTRAIWKDGWRAVTVHGPQPINKGHFDEDVWQLFHIDTDRSEAHDLAGQEPERLKEMIALWNSEAEKYGVLPLSDLGVAGDLALEFKVPVLPSGVYRSYPETLEVPERSAANTHGVSYRILAEVDLTDAAEGVIMAHGSRFGGHALFIKDHRLHYGYNFLGIPPEQHLAGEAVLSPGKHILGVDFAKQSVGEHGESHGVATLYIDDEAVATQEIRTQTGRRAGEVRTASPTEGAAGDDVAGVGTRGDHDRVLGGAARGARPVRGVRVRDDPGHLHGALAAGRPAVAARAHGRGRDADDRGDQRDRRRADPLDGGGGPVTRSGGVSSRACCHGSSPLAAAMQLPLLMSFAYSVGQPLSDAAALTRGLAVLLALPIYVVAVALAFQVDQRRPLVLGAAQALGALATTLGHAAAGAATRAENAAALTHFRAAITRLRDSALPVGGERGDPRRPRAGPILRLDRSDPRAGAQRRRPRDLAARRRGGGDRGADRCA